MRNRLSAIATGLCLTFALAGGAPAQQNPNLENGLKPYWVYEGGNVDSISTSNGSLTVEIPLVSFPQRGGKLSAAYSIRYTSKAFHIWKVCNYMLPCEYYWMWDGNSVSVGTDQRVGVKSRTVYYNNQPITLYSATTADGATHELGNVQGASWESLDATAINYNTSTKLAYDQSGVRYWQNGSTASYFSEDPSGNQFTALSNGSITDTLGRVVPPVPGPLTVNPPVADTQGCPAGTNTVAYWWNLPGPNNGTYSLKLCYSDISIRTNFTLGVPHYTEYYGTQKMLTAIILPNNKAWFFEYSDSNPGDPSGTNYASLTRITLPTGGTLSYHYTNMSDCTVGTTTVSRWVNKRTLDANDGTGPHDWTYTYGATTKATDPLGNVTAHTLTSLGSSCSRYVTQSKYYQGAESTQNLLKTVTTTYSYSPNPHDIYGDGATTVINVVPTGITTSWPGGKTSKVERAYDSGFTFEGSHAGTYGNVTELREYAYGSGSPGALTRKTTTTYLAFSSSNYKTYHLMDLVASVIVRDGAGTQKAYTSYGYDGASLQSSGVTTQHNSNPVNGTYRGNQTSVGRWLNTTGGYLTTQRFFYDTGMLQQEKDPLLHPTTFEYSPTFVGAYLTKVTNAVGHITQYNYDFNSGKLTSATDPNGRTTTYAYDLTWDPMGRLKQVGYPDGGQVSYAYDDTPPVTVTTTTKITDSLSSVIESEYDGVARLSKTTLTSDPDGPSKSEISYDALGRKSCVTNPYRSTGDPTYGQTCTSYDALGRVTKVVPPDGSTSSNNITTAYADNCTTVTDQQGKARKSCKDALGRIIQVFEPNSGGSFIYETDYQYDTLDNLTRADQKGNDSNSANWRTRTYVYDSLSRLTSASNPESGNVTYTYNDDGLLLTRTAPMPNQTGSLTVTTTYGYDTVHRLTSKSYSNGDPSVGYSYDASTCLGLSSCYNTGRRTTMTDGAGTASWAYDPMGRTWVKQRVTNGVTKTASYLYNYDGSLASLTYPSGHQITYLPGGAGRPLNAVDSGSGINYVTAAHYSPSGVLSTLQNGASLSSTFLYNSRLQPCWIYATTGTPLPTSTLCSGAAATGNILDLKYNLNLGTADNGNVMGITNTRDATHHRDQSFTYDALNRITTAGTLDWSQTFTTDIWANLYNIVATGGAPGLNQTAGANNRLSGLGYDAAGDTTNDGLYNYVYDAEGRNCSVGGTTCANGTMYTYDGDGKRVKKSTGTLYWYGGGSDALLETDLSGGLQNEYIFFGGKRVARRDASNNVFYYFADHLGSSRVMTSSTGAVCYDADFYPYGGERVVTNTCPQNYKFTGKERDAETQNDYFGARFHESNLGRFLTPDPLMASGRASNPQTWNRYAYTLNNPLRFIDPYGLEEQPCATTDQECGKKRQASKGKGRYVLTAGIAVLVPVTSDSQQAHKQNQPQPQPATQDREKNQAERVGNVVHNETGGLRPNTKPGSEGARDLYEAKVDVAHVVINRLNVGDNGGVASDRVSTQEKRTSEYGDAQSAALTAANSADTTGGAKHFYLDFGQGGPKWAQGETPVATHGPFLNAAGGGDVPKGAWVIIVIIP